jgi:hypothetical protein
MAAYLKLDAAAHEAPEAARRLRHGALRSAAMKKAGELRLAADKARDRPQP